jgi:hypothetical protein
MMVALSLYACSRGAYPSMPDWVANKTAWLERIRAAKASLEAEAKKPPPDNDGPGPSSGMTKSGKPDRGPDGGPPDRAQRNFTDLDSRIQPMRSGAVIASGKNQADGSNIVLPARGKCAKLAPYVGGSSHAPDGIAALSGASAISHDRRRYTFDHVICADADALQARSPSNGM